MVLLTGEVDRLATVRGPQSECRRGLFQNWGVDIVERHLYSVPMTTIADLTRSKFNDFAITNLILIDGLVDRLSAGSVHVSQIAQNLIDSGERKRLRDYADGTRSAYLFLSEKELGDLSAEVRDQLDILTAFHGINETINLMTRFGLYTENRCASVELSDEDTKRLQHAISIYQYAINLGTELERILLSEINSAPESVVSLIALTAAQRGDSGVFDMAVSITISPDQR